MLHYPQWVQYNGDRDVSFTSQTVGLAADPVEDAIIRTAQLLQGRDTLTGEQASLLSWFSHKMADMAEDRPASGQVCIYALTASV